MQFAVELRPHIGMTQTKLGMVPVQHAQDCVFVCGQEIADAFGSPKIMVGYAGHQTATIEFLPHVRTLGPGAPERICDEVRRITGRPRSSNMPAKHVTDPGQVETPVDLDRQIPVPMIDLDAA
jgi:hypothetical protein